MKDPYVRFVVKIGAVVAGILGLGFGVGRWLG